MKINRSSNKSNRPSPIDGVKDVTTSKNKITQASQNSNGKKHAEVVKNDTQFSQNISSDEEIDMKGLSNKEMIDEAAKKGVTTKSQNYQQRAENRLYRSISKGFAVSGRKDRKVSKYIIHIKTDVKILKYIKN